MSMPNVFVVPPEEDHTPPWCFFDAENPALSQIMERPETPEIGNLSFPSDDDTPTLSRHRPGAIDTAIMPRRSTETVSVVDALMSEEGHANEDSDSDSEFEGDMNFPDHSHAIQESNRSEPSRTHDREPANDSDVIEVVKVSRRKSSSDEQHDQERQSLRAFSDYKRTTTLKSRASKVFKSLKGSLRSSKPRVQDIFPLAPSSSSSSQISQEPESVNHPPQETVPRPRTPIVSRRGSRILSQLFVAPSLKSRSSVSSFDDSPSSPELNPVSSPPFSPQSDFTSNAPSRRSSFYNRADHDEARLKATSPTPTMASYSNKRRFSIMSLQKLFSFSSSTPNPHSHTASPVSFDEPDRATPIPRSTSCTPPSAASSVTTVSALSGPQTPTSTEVTPEPLVRSKDSTDLPVFDSFDSVFEKNAGLNLGLGLSLDSSPYPQPTTAPGGFSASGSLGSWGSITHNIKPSAKASSQIPRTHDDPGDTSLEMRLDSFHFDSISFDAGQF
ncbi:hypothetical protein GALMADRAFT_251074 [Galerina marginata CBS 339.88]|uniref:Uncharacterized protein n=1 Tax=Galerina marginata (strain CBS 339.88) TaxID=685588 RepID=A0A067T333_GALM3|nr:hypothetical protein GALMADRAFT_251074 [Galerina marginata CBS 339.88]